MGMLFYFDSVLISLSYLLYGLAVHLLNHFAPDVLELDHVFKVVFLSFGYIVCVFTLWNIGGILVSVTASSIDLPELLSSSTTLGMAVYHTIRGRLQTLWARIPQFVDRVQCLTVSFRVVRCCGNDGGVLLWDHPSLFSARRGLVLSYETPTQAQDRLHVNRNSRI